MITGVGPITPIGHGRGPFWEAVIAGKSGTKSVDFEWIAEKGFRCRVGAPVESLDRELLVHVDETEVSLLDPATQFALAAANLALTDAGLRVVEVDDRRSRYRLDAVDAERCGVVLGTGIGGLCTLEQSHRRWVRGEPIGGSLRYSLPKLIPNALPAQVAIKFGLRGECKAVVTACAAGTMAIGDAFRLIRAGDLDLAISGGVERTLSDHDGFGLWGFDLLNTLSRRNDEPGRASRPFDKDRDGFVLGEGAGLLVLENEDHARARGARIYAEVVGYASTCDAHSMMQIAPSGGQIVRVMRRALEAATADPQDVGYVNAHGTSTRQNDAHECQALQRVFGRRIADVLVNSTKAMTGHAIGAAGGIEAITTVLSLFHGLVHRCVNLDSPDPECDVPLPRENALLRPSLALSNSFGFGRHNATLVFGPA